MEPATIETLRALATIGGLELTDEELAALLPLVIATRSMMEAVREALASEIEPTTQYRIL